ncbi:MAG TPA: SGNH/GDSL hydrolase family protein [Cytophagaceae bacterium]|jgi:lysophospholipase L1-like esterase|nr:SGNH/GDSL hydrolase family protein [Cytophagaceae bacterium]
MKNQVLILLFLLTIISCKAQEKNQITLPANAKEISYAGRVDFSHPMKPSFCYSGVSIKTVFTGTTLSMLMEDLSSGDEQHTNYFAVVVDDKFYKTLQIEQGQQSYELAKGLSYQKHSIEIFKRTECAVGSCIFLGFKAAAGTVFEKPVEKKYRIEFIGDSFTCGYGNEVSIVAPPEGNPNTGFHSKNENHYLTYGAIVARKLNVEYRCIAYSGRGLYRNNTGSEEGTLPKIYLNIFPDEVNGALWDVKKEIPDVVVIKLGTNDFFPESQGNYLDDTSFVKTYIEFVKKLRSYYPLAKIVCITGVSMSDYWPAERKCLTRIQHDVQNVVTEINKAGDQLVYYVNLATQIAPYGEDWHATIVSQQKMADQLMPFLKEITNW